MKDLSLGLIVSLFVAASVAIWLAGTRLERAADVIARRTGLGHAFTGMLLLAAATSLPEVATTVTAVVLLDNPSLAVYNLVGGVALQTAILIIADAAKRGTGALTFAAPRFVLLLQGLGLIFLLQIVVAGITAGGTPTVSFVSAWLVLLFVAYVAVMYLVYRYRKQSRWTPTGVDDAHLADDDMAADDDGSSQSLTKTWLYVALSSSIVLGGGWLATETADAMAERSGLSPEFLGATLLAVATSLPEVSTTVSAARNGRYTVAMSNVFGSNAFDVTLLVLAEVLYFGGSIFERVDTSVIFVATIGSLMTCIYLWGMMEREDRTVFGVGWDSAAAAVVYLGGMSVLYFLV